MRTKRQRQIEIRTRWDLIKINRIIRHKCNYIWALGFQWTRKVNIVAFRAFVRFELKQFLEENPEALLEDHFFKVKQLLFDDINGYSHTPSFNEWNSVHFKKVPDYLIEFAVHHWTTNDDQVKPATMKGYLDGLQWFFMSEWKYDLNVFKGEVFAFPNEGLLAIIDSLFS